MRNFILKNRIVILIVVVLFYIGSFGLIYLVFMSDRQNESNTTSYTATVSSVDIINDQSSLIYIKEYENALLVMDVIMENIDVSELECLNSGQQIYFRIENYEVDYVNEVEFVEIVSLSTDEKDIFTLDDYNSYMSRAALPAKIASIVFNILLLIIIVLLLRTFRCGIRINLRK